MKIRYLLVLPLAVSATVLLGPPGSAWASTAMAESHTSQAMGAYVVTTQWPSPLGSLSGIAAAKCGEVAKWPAIGKANGITRPELLQVGRRLWVPCARSGQAAPRPPVQANAGGVRSWVAPLSSYRASTCYEWRPALYVNGTLVSKAGLHTGLDLAASLGAPIRAVAAGRVIRVGWRGGFGNAVEIAHGSGVTSMYAHQSRILVRYNQWVGVGQVIGRVGSTGASTGNHLHLAMYRNGSTFNPTPYLEARGVPIRGC